MTWLLCYVQAGRFLGAVVVNADDQDAAEVAASVLGVDPSGEVIAQTIVGVQPDERWHGRLLERHELEQMTAELRRAVVHPHACEGCRVPGFTCLCRPQGRWHHPTRAADIRPHACSLGYLEPGSYLLGVEDGFAIAAWLGWLGRLR